MTVTIEDKVIEWARDRNILQDPSALKQHEKLEEEVQELKVALEANNLEEVIDALGDIQVVLLIIHEMLDMGTGDTLYSAWNEIKDRKGKLVNGIFVKEEK